MPEGKGHKPPIVKIDGLSDVLFPTQGLIGVNGHASPKTDKASSLHNLQLDALLAERLVQRLPLVGADDDGHLAQAST